MSSETKTSQLRLVRDAVWNLTTSPLYLYRKENHYYPVLGEGSHDTAIMFIGEAPGKTEAETGRPFCGAAGKLLDELLHSIQLSRKDVYITNLIKDRPPQNRDPYPEEIEVYRLFLDQQIAILQPKLLITLGRFSLQYLLQKLQLPQIGLTITKLHGKPLHATAEYGEVLLLPLYHPAVALYNIARRQMLFDDFNVIKNVLSSRETV